MKTWLVVLLSLVTGACGSSSPGPGGIAPGPPAPFRRDIFVGGEGGYHTYRIPALVRSRAGTLLAFCEGRTNNILDHGDIDLLVRRSLDGGNTWEPAQIVWEDGPYTVGNPAPVVDRETGTIWVAFCWNNLKVYVTRSDDDGIHWSTPTEITRDVKPWNWAWYATGPGHGIQLSGGRLLIACDHSVGLAPYAHVIYSDDHGETWQPGGTTDRLMNECQAVELADGSVYLTMRNYAFANRRAGAVSADRGATWSSSWVESALVDSVCQASIVRPVREDGAARGPIYFLNPASTQRERLTVRISYDETASWPVSRVLNEGPSAYSDMTILPGRAVAALYENGSLYYAEKITFCRVSTDWIEQEDGPPGGEP